MLTVLLPVLLLPLNHPSLLTIAHGSIPPSAIQTHTLLCGQLKRECILESWHGESRKAIGRFNGSV